MQVSSDTSEYLPALVGLAALLVIISRLVRIARLNTPTQADNAGAVAAPARRALWGPARRLEKLNQNTALVRAETDLITSTGEQVQARHNLNRLMVELAPPQNQAPAGQQPAVPSLTVPEIRAVLAAVDLPPDVRATLLDLFEATASEKVRQ